MGSLSPKDVDRDMVVYKYYKDSLISWVNTFPVINDSYSPGAMYPNLSFFSRNTILYQPLSGIDGREQYLNLGSAWYVVRAYSREDVTIITGIQIQTDFPFSNSFVESKVNRTLRLPAYCSIVPLNLDEGFIVFGKDDGVLFTILSNTSMQTYYESVILRWLAITLVICSLLMFFFRNRKVAYALGLITSLCLLRFLTFIFSSSLQPDTLFFTPAVCRRAPGKFVGCHGTQHTMCFYCSMGYLPCPSGSCANHAEP